ncbi:MAG: helix-turn-helix transcriptional regulator [Bacilli bacterium]|nr:helix-turn-helix transcriptional regulator [Bacilli bacterium]
MDSEKIGKLIKDIRTKNNLSQQKFADRYGVTYQAVSKWENGKNIPDIAILKEICNDYNIDLASLLDEKETVTKKPQKKLFFVSFLVCGLIIILLLGVYLKKNNDFNFKTLSPNCSNFNLYGSIAYNDLKSSIHISNITYCGGNDEKEYKKITCVLYESDDKTKTVISENSYFDDNRTKKLDQFLKDVDFVVDNYKNKCKIYKENSLYLEIEAVDLEDNITAYHIPLKLDDNC